MATETKTEVATTTTTETKETQVPSLREDKALSVDGISKDKLPYYRAICKSLNESDLTSVIDYGSDLQRAMDSYSNDFLNQQMTSRLDIEAADLVANLLGELKEVDIDDFQQGGVKRFLAKIPFMKKFITSFEKIQAKYNTIQKNIDGIVERIEATKQIALRDNNLLQKQLENNVDYVQQLEDLIVAGKLKSKELKEQIHFIEDGVEPGTELQLHDLRDYVAALDKRLTDLTLLRYAFQQSLIQIRIIQNTNMMDIMNTETQIKMAIPVWKNQLCLAVALSNQQKSLAAKNLLSDTTNKIMTKNAEMMKTQAIEVVKQNQRTVIDIDTLKKTTADLLATVEGVQKAQRDGAAQRAAAEAEIKRLEKQVELAANGTKETTERIIASELKGTKYNALSSLVDSM